MKTKRKTAGRKPVDVRDRPVTARDRKGAMEVELILPAGRKAFESALIDQVIRLLDFHELLKCVQARAEAEADSNGDFWCALRGLADYCDDICDALDPDALRKRASEIVEKQRADEAGGGS